MIVPKNTNLWSWLFESEQPRSTTKGFTDAITKEHINYTELKSLTTHASTALVENYDVSPGEVISVFSRNSIWYPVATLSAVRIGAVACGVSPEYTIDELSFALKLSKTKIIFTTEELLAKATSAAESLGLPAQNVILLDGKPGPRRRIQDLIVDGSRLGAPREAKVFQIPERKTSHDINAFICFSSGTTGLPKAVMISHGNIVAQCLQVMQITPPDHDKVLAALPFNHITGIVHQLHLPIALNANTYVLGKFDFESLLRTVADNKIKELLVVPPILIRMVRQPEIVAKYDLSHVERFSSGAAPLSKEIINLLEKQFPNTGFKQGYGMTESCSAICSHPPSKYAFKYADKVGMVVASTEVRIVHTETGKLCEVGQAGEIWARGPQVVRGYLENPTATAETFTTDGFLRTGDIGFIDEEGLLSITDRMKEMIKVKGVGVAPAELENLLLGHPAVSDCAVCGIPDERAGERPKAFIVLSPSFTDRPREVCDGLFEFVRANKSRYKALAEIEVVKAIPKSPSGKILRKVLRTPDKAKSRLAVRESGERAKL